MAESSIKEKLENNLDNLGLGLYDNSLYFLLNFVVSLKLLLKMFFKKKERKSAVLKSMVMSADKNMEPNNWTTVFPSIIHGYQVYPSL